jgi:hypothetical protein
VLFTSLQVLFQAFTQRFALPTKADSSTLLDLSEFDLFLSGEPVLDWMFLPNVTTYKKCSTAESRTIRWFWAIFWDLSEQEQRQFLKLATGTGCAPFGGVGKISLCIERCDNVALLPMSHTCFNCLRLPDCESKKVMDEKIKIAIQYTEGFGIE